MSRGTSADLHPSGATGDPPWAASPSADRPRRARWRDPRLVVGIALVALCTVLGARLLGGADDSVDVWVARATLDAGRPVDATDLVPRQVRFADQADADHYLSADRPVPTPATLTRAVGAGELLPRAALGGGASQSLTEVPVSVGTDAVSGNVRVGSTVDVWVTPGSPSSDPDAKLTGRGARRSTLVFDDVAVVSAPRPGSSLGPTATRQVIVGVGKDQTSRLPISIAALASGTVLLTEQR